VVGGVASGEPRASCPGAADGRLQGNGAGGGQADAGVIAAGKSVFDANGCGRCHAVGGQGGGRAPDLSHEGADPNHTPSGWPTREEPALAEPGSRMPAFEGKISDRNSSRSAFTWPASSRRSRDPRPLAPAVGTSEPRSQQHRASARDETDRRSVLQRSPMDRKESNLLPTAAACSPR